MSVKVEQFLNNTRDTSKALCVVMGNESCDLDSVVSSICWAWYKQNIALDMKEYDTNYIPVFNVNRSDLELRCDIVMVLRECGIDTKNCIFLDDIDLKAESTKPNFQVHLVDHNMLAEKQKFLTPYVAYVVDHHKDMGQFAHQNIQLVGSCASIVASIIHMCVSHYLTQSRSVCLLLLSAILLDTGNMDPSLGKTKELDIAMIELLQSILSGSLLYSTLRDARFDTSQLNTQQLLRKDLKLTMVWSDITKSASMPCAIASVPCSLNEMISKESDMLHQCYMYMIENKISLLAVMTIFTDKESNLCRELLLMSSADQPLNIVNYLVSHRKCLDLLNLQPIDRLVTNGEVSYQFAAFKQLNVKSSRKQVLPLLQDYQHIQ